MIINWKFLLSCTITLKAGFHPDMCMTDILILYFKYVLQISLDCFYFYFRYCNTGIYNDDHSLVSEISNNFKVKLYVPTLQGRCQLPFRIFLVVLLKAFL